MYLLHFSQRLPNDNLHNAIFIVIVGYPGITHHLEPTIRVFWSELYRRHIWNIVT